MTWIPNFHQQCCDALYYMEIAMKCFRNGDCAVSYRPLGSTLYHMIPLALGLPPNGIILVNWLLMGLSILLSVKALKALWPSLNRVWGLTVFSALVHGAYMYMDCFVALTDVGASCFALVGLWSLLLGIERKSAVWLAIGGLSAGAAAMMRVFYLYPAYLFGAAMFASHWFARRPSRKEMLAAVLAFSIPVLTQYIHTYKNLGHWAFSSEDRNSQVGEFHKRSTIWGYDTMMAPVQGVVYDGAYLLKVPNNGFYYSLLEGDPIGATKLALKRLQFYFGSFADRTYIVSAKDRIFSNWLVAVYLGLFLAFGYAVLQSSWQLVPMALFLSGCVALGTAIAPEQRFFMLPYVILWLVGPLFLLQRWLSPKTEAAAAPVAPIIPEPLALPSRRRASKSDAPKAPPKPERSANAWGLSAVPKRKPAKKKATKKKRK